MDQSLLWIVCFCKLLGCFFFYNKQEGTIGYFDVIRAISGQGAVGSGCWYRSPFVWSYFPFTNLGNMSKFGRDSFWVTHYTILSEQHTLARPYCFMESGKYVSLQEQTKHFRITGYDSIWKTKTGPADHECNILTTKAQWPGQIIKSIVKQQ